MINENDQNDQNDSQGEHNQNLELLPYKKKR